MLRNFRHRWSPNKISFIHMLLVNVRIAFGEIDFNILLMDRSEASFSGQKTFFVSIMLLGCNWFELTSLVSLMCLLELVDVGGVLQHLFLSCDLLSLDSLLIGLPLANSILKTLGKFIHVCVVLEYRVSWSRNHVHFASSSWFLATHFIILVYKLNIDRQYWNLWF